MLRHVRKERKGFTLIEVMVALMSSSIILTGIYQILHSQHNTYMSQGDRIELQQNLRSGIYLMSKDLRSIRYNPMGISISECINFRKNMEPDNIFTDIGKNNIDYKLDTDRLVFVTDKNSNGTIELQNDGIEYGAIRLKGQVLGPIPLKISYEEGERGEFIGYRQHEGELQRFNSELYTDPASLAQAWQTVATNVDALNFVYIDDFGARIFDPGMAKAIQVALLIRASKEDLDYTNTESYKNHQGDFLCTSCNSDHYHRRLILMTIRLRNGFIKSCTS